MNIILISMDTTRADRLSCYGHFRRTSPHIDGVAAAGALFREHFSPHIPTYPGHTTMMTGRDLYAHRITGQSGTPELAADIPLLAQILAAHGYYTAAADNLGRWFGRGFANTWTYRWDTSGSEWRKAEAVTTAALQALQTAAGQNRPFFLFLHYWDPHTPYLPPGPFSRMFYEGDEHDPVNRSMDPVWTFENFKWYFNEWMPGVTDIEFPKAQYDAEIAYMDACLAHLFTRIEELGLRDETLLALTADHGEELDEHGCWFDHHGLYDTNIHIPLILRLPGVIPAGARIDGLTRMQDLTPTLLDYAGLLDPTLAFDGVSLKPLIDAPGGPARGTCDMLHCTENTWMKKRAVRTHRWKLIVPLETPDIHDRSEIELYDLTVDPAEQHNIALAHPEEVRRLQLAMDEWVKVRLGNSAAADPLLVQPIPLRRIGKQVAVPSSQADKEVDVNTAQGNEGYATEGHPTEGHRKAGYATEGHATEGHATEGHATEGHRKAGHSDKADQHRQPIADNAPEPLALHAESAALAMTATGAEPEAREPDERLAAGDFVGYEREAAPRQASGTIQH